MCILCGNYVNLFKRVFDFRDRSLNIVSNFFIDGICVVPLAHATSTMSVQSYVPTLCYDVVYEWLVFCDIFV